LPKTDKNSFYYHEIIGYTILDQDSKKIGDITGVNDQTPQHLFQINTCEKKALIPINDKLIINVDKKNKIIKMDLPDGILDI
jgi:16S rRNA processing protein RimM